MKKYMTILGGTTLIAGATIGAGMLGLPTISAGMWFNWSAILLIVSWFFMFRASQALLEVNLHFEPGDSYHTLTMTMLGKPWTVINGFAVAFANYTYIYAYVSGGGSICKYMFAPLLGPDVSQAVVSLIFIVLLSIFMWWSSKAVDRICIILMAGLAIALVISIVCMLGNIHLTNLLDLEGEGGSMIFIWCALATYVTSFCYHANVPSLMKYIGKDSKTINRCIRYGSLTALVCYMAWLCVADGLIPRAEFKQVIQAGGNVGNLLSAAGGNLDNNLIMFFVNFFSLFAVASSFLGIGLGLFDYLADLFGFDNSHMGRLKTVIVTVGPPLFCGLIWPNGFLYALGWAGMAACVWSIIVPALLLRKVRVNRDPADFVTPGGSFLVPALLIYSAIVIVCELLFMANLLPMYK